MKSNERHFNGSASGKELDKSGGAEDSVPKPIGMINVSTSVYGRNPSNRACSLGSKHHLVTCHGSPSFMLWNILECNILGSVVGLTSVLVAIAAPYQDSGYGTEAVCWTIDWAFRRANMHVSAILPPL